MRARIIGKSSAARGRARSRRSSSIRARIIGKSSAARGRVTFPPFSCDPDADYPTAAIGAIRLGSLFLTLPTRALTGQHIIHHKVACEQCVQVRGLRRLFAEPDRRALGLRLNGGAVGGNPRDPTLPDFLPP